MAIKAQKDEQATLQQINDWLIQNFLFFRGEYIGWKNSVRHNLSLNDCFVKVISSIFFANASDNDSDLAVMFGGLITQFPASEPAF